jgi:hypothetical protein
MLANDPNPEVAIRVTQRTDGLRHAFALHRQKYHPSSRDGAGPNVAIARRLRRKLAFLYARYVGKRSMRSQD